MISKVMHLQCVCTSITSIKCSLRTKSLTHDERGLRDGYAAVAHKPGTWREGGREGGRGET